MKVCKAVYTSNGLTGTESETNELVEDAISLIIQEAIKHFNKIKRSVRDPEEDARFFWNDEELNMFLKGIEYPDRIWVSTVYDEQGKFYAYRVGRIVIGKKGAKKV